MTPYAPLVLIFALALAISFAVTPLVRLLACRLKITDGPDGHRKLQQRPIPLGGGVNIFIGLWAAVIAALALPDPWPATLAKNGQNLLALFAGSLVITVIGLIDDRFTLRGRHKLIGQIAAASILIGSGLVIRNIALFQLHLQLGILAVPFTLLWLLLAINALNLLDGIDGLATTVGIVLSSTIAVIALLSGNPTEALVMSALAGSLLGFLRFNFPPAKMYLGDAGSMLIGLMIGALAIRASIKGPATVALAAPLAIWAIPIFDTVAAILRRKLTGRSIYAGDRAHLHHRVAARSGSTPRALSWIALACTITSLGALCSVYLKSDLFAALTAAAVIGVLIATRVFGYVELVLLSSKLKSVGLSLLVPTRPHQTKGRQASVRLQGSRPWDHLWRSLVEFTQTAHLHSMRLDVNVPAYQEAFYASWNSPQKREASDLWRTEIPLYAGQRIVGRLSITGESRELTVCEAIERLMDLLQPFESQLVELAMRTPAEIAQAIERTTESEPSHAA